MNIALKLGLAASSLLLLAACETPPRDGSGLNESGDIYGGYNDGDRSAYDSDGMLAPGVSDRVFYALDSSVLSSQAQRTLERQANWLRNNPGMAIVVEGHCDERGTREYNLALGERRAASARNYLVSLGVPAGRISTVSYGKERPAVIGSNESAWSQNRRAVTVLAR